MKELNSNEGLTGQDVVDTTPKVNLKAKKMQFGPGFVNLAIPDRGHAPSCVAYEFLNAETFNQFCAEHQNFLTIMTMPLDHGFLVIFNELKTEATMEEMEVASKFAQEKLDEFKKQRDERAAEVQKQEEENSKRDEALRAIGRLCIEKHGAVGEHLPNLSVVKNVRKTIADDILKAVQEVAGDAGVERLEKVLAKYVKDGTK